MCKLWPFSPKNTDTNKTYTNKATCQHKWKGCSWFLTYSLRDHFLRYTIYKPYVCIFCKERQDIALDVHEAYFTTDTAAHQQLMELRKQYPEIKDRVCVEEEINDLRLVDKEYLKYASIVTGVDYTK